MNQFEITDNEKWICLSEKLVPIFYACVSIKIVKFEAIAPRSCHACVFSSSFSYLRCHHHWTEIKIIMDYFIFTINRNRLFPSFVASFFALFLSVSYGPCFIFFLSLCVCADQVILLCASVARSSHVHVPLSLSISFSFFLSLSVRFPHYFFL